MTARDRILARRARFITAATITSGVLACSEAQACLDVAVVEDAASDTGPEPCLFAPNDTGQVDTADVRDTFESTDAAETSVTDSAADTTDTGPMPCLIPPLDSGA